MSTNRKILKSDFKFGYSSVENITENYLIWVKQKLYVLLWATNITTGETIYTTIKGRKRGDQDYSNQIIGKFFKLGKKTTDTIFFNKKQRENIEGNAILATLNFDSNKYTITDSWENSGKYWNQFLTNIKNKYKNQYGKISQIRVFESNENAYPHIHAIIIFRDHKLQGKRMYSQKQGRIINRLFGVDHQKLKTSWKYGFSDFQLISSYKGAIKYLSKYLEKSTNYKLAGTKGQKTLALAWVFSKRSFSASKNLYNDVIEVKTNSILVNEFGVEYREICIGIDLFQEKIIQKHTRWKLFGFCQRLTSIKTNHINGYIDPLRLVLDSEFDNRSRKENRKYYKILDQSKPIRKRKVLINQSFLN